MIHQYLITRLNVYRDTVPLYSCLQKPLTSLKTNSTCRQNKLTLNFNKRKNYKDTVISANTQLN